MIRRVFGTVVALLGLGLVGFATAEFWDAMTLGFDYTGVISRIIMLSGFDYAGPISIVAIGFLGGLCFASGCIISTPLRKE